MRYRKKPLGNKNMLGRKTTSLREQQGMKQRELAEKMQLLGVDIDPFSLSKLEGQTRVATDAELLALSQIFGVEIKDLFNDEP